MSKSKEKKQDKKCSNSENEELKKFREDTSSKLEGLKIKLYDYSYFHSTTKIHNQRKVERRELKGKLNSLINESNSKCGAYLVTGYRGVGKSSIVQELILENSSKKRSAFPLKYIILRIFFFSILFKLIGVAINKYFGGANVPTLLSSNAKFAYLILLILTLALLLYYFLKSSGFNFSYKDQKRKKDGAFKKFKNSFSRAISFIYNKISNRRYLQVISDYIIIFLSVLCAFSVTVFKLKENYKYLSPLLNTVLPIAIILFIFYFGYFKDFKSFKNEFLKNCFIKYRKLFININFGHDELDERDIFRLMAHNLRDSFNKRYKSFRLKLYEFSYKLIICLFIFFFISKLYVGNNSTSKIRKEIVKAYGVDTSFVNGESVVTQNFANRNANSKEGTQQLPDDNAKSTISKPPSDSSLNDNAIPDKFDGKQINIVSQSEKVNVEINSDKAEGNSLLSRLYQGLKTGIKNTNKLIIGIFNIEKNGWYIDAILFVLCYLFAWFLMRIINRTTYKKILNSLDDLINQIESQVTSSSSSEVNHPGFFTSFNKQKSYPMASTREIERRLISIFESMRQLPFLYQRFEVVFIFDELDKLEPRNTNGNDKSNGNDKINHSSMVTGVTPDSVRKRQGNVFKVLANMKYFLTSANAKFIFLAGREMYDAALADVADRNSFLSSIFYDIIYVPSIFNVSNDNSEPSNTTDFVEQFVCQQLMPYYDSDKKSNLKDYNQFLINNFKFDKKIKPSESEKPTRDEIINKQKREKIIFTLYHFTIYLTHLSNGSTKKMISLFEDFVVMADKDENTLFANKMIKKGELYLRFEEKDQQLFAMINFLAGPLIQKQNMLGNNIYSDKLLVQTSYITDHILKFHRQPFTDGSLELIPEIVDPNRSPELRALLNDVITGYTKTHLEKVSFNLPNYKFNRLIQHEISYISKLDEQASAAFNFSLDESLASKRHYYQLLESNSSDVNSCCAFSYILGELHFFDEQYDESIQYYSKALARFSGNKFPVDKKDVLFYIKVNLKMGLVFEKRKAYEAAFSYYQTSIDTAIYNSYELKKEIEFCKLSYQAILAKLFLIEKSNSIGVTRVDLDQAEKDFKVIMNRTDEIKTSLFKSDFYYKLATLLYWKNQENKEYKVKNLEYLALGFNSIDDFKIQSRDDKDFKESLRVLLDLFKLENKELRDRLNQEKIKQLNKCVTLLANILLSNYEIEKVRIEFIDPESNAILSENANITEIAILLISHASRLAKLNNDDKMYIWQKTKVLYIIKYLISNKRIVKHEQKNGEGKGRDRRLEISSYLIKKIIRAAYSMEDNIYKIEIEKIKNFFGEQGKDDYISKKEISLKRATVAFELEEPLTVFEDIQMLCAKDVVSQYKHYHTTPYCLGTTSLNQMLWLKSKFHLNFEIFKKYFYNDKDCPLNTSKEGKPNRIDLPKFSYTNFYKWFNYLFSSRSDTKFEELCTDLGILIDCKGNYKNEIFECILYDSIYCGLEIIRIYKSHGDNKLLSNMFMTRIHEYMILWTSILNFYLDYYKNRRIKYEELVNPEKINRMIYSVACLNYFNDKGKRTNKDMYKTFEIFDKNKNADVKIFEYQKELIIELLVLPMSPKFEVLNKKIIDFISEKFPDKNKVLNEYKLHKGHEDLFEKRSMIKLLKPLKKIELKKLPKESCSVRYVPNLEYLQILIGENRMSQLNHVYYAEETRKLYHYTDSKLRELFGYKNEQQNLFYLNDDFTDDRTHFLMAMDRFESRSEYIADKIEDLKYLFFNSQYYEPQRYFETVTD